MTKNYFKLLKKKYKTLEKRNNKFNDIEIINLMAEILFKLDLIQNHEQSFEKEKSSNKFLIAELKNEIKCLKEQSQRAYTFEEKEYDEIVEWQTQHNINKHKNMSSMKISQGQFSYIFTPTMLGLVKECQCTICFKEAEKARNQFPKETLEDIKKIKKEYDYNISFTEF